MGCDSTYGFPTSEGEDKLMKKEAKKTDVKLIENAENIPGIKLKQLKPAIKKNGPFQRIILLL